MSKARESRASEASIFNVSPQSRSLFSDSLWTFGLPVRSYLNRHKYRLFCSIPIHLVVQTYYYYNFNFFFSTALLGTPLIFIQYKFIIQHTRKKKEKKRRKNPREVGATGLTSHARHRPSGKLASRPFKLFLDHSNSLSL